MAAGLNFVLSVSGIQDLADPANTILAGSSIGFEGPADSGVGLAHRWPCDEGSGATAADDVGAWDAALAGAGWDAGGHSGSALALDGASRADLGAVALGGSACTIALWCKPSGFDAGVDARFISKATSTAEQDHYWMLGLSEGSGTQRLRARLRAGGSTATLVAGGTDIPAGSWQHAALVYDGAVMKLFLGGAEVASAPKSGALDTGAGVLASIGGQPSGAGGNGFRGLLDDIRIYTNALTASEIAALMNPQPGARDLYADWVLGLSPDGPGEDNESDGGPNLLEFLFGGDPLAPEFAAIAPRLWSSADGARIGILIRDARGILPIRVEGGTDLLHWVPLASLPGYSDAPAGSEDGVPLRLISITRPEGATWFLRLRTAL
jgi:hypothetical protein